MQTSMHSCFGVVILIGLIAVLSVPQPAIAQLAWDLADDFSISNGNPHDVIGATWDYQYRTSTSASPTTFAGTRVNNRAPGGGGTKWDLPPNEAWVRNASGAEDAISLNKFSADAGPNDLTVYKAGEIGGHSTTGAQWFAPSDGDYKVEFSGFYARREPIGRDQVLRIVRPDNSQGSWTIDEIDNNGSENAVEICEVLSMTTGQQVTVEVIPQGSDGDFVGMSMTISEIMPTNNSFTWNSAGGGDWNATGVSSNWCPTGPPNGNEDIVFGGSIEGPSTVFADTPVSVQSLTFDSSNTYAIGGLGGVNLIADTQGSNTAAIDVLQGTHHFQAPVNLMADTTATVNSGATLVMDNALDLGGNTLTKMGDGELAIRHDLILGGGTINMQQGIVSGGGVINGDVTNNGGVISPGNRSASAAVVPEPASTMLLFWAGMAAFTLWRFPDFR